MTKLGTVYLLGAGPGDPELVTVRAVRRLSTADVVLFDALVHPEVLHHCPGAEKVFVGKRAGRVSERQDEINRRMAIEARRGRQVVRLKGGDPYLFGRGSEEAEFLAQEGIPFEVVPGIPSPLAAAAYGGFSLTHRDKGSSVVYLTATESPAKDRTSHDWSKLATCSDALVIFMGMRKLGSLMELLTEHGRSPDTPAAVIQDASLPTQRVLVATVGTIAQRAREAKMGTPALTVVGSILELRPHLRWFDTLPLFGRRILVTRPAQQASELSQMLRDRGAHAVELPLIRIAPPADPAPLHKALRALDKYTWVVFTSPNAVSAVLSELHAVGEDARAFAKAKVCAVGPRTRLSLEAHGLRADLVPREYHAEALADALIQELPADASDARVLFPRAEAGRNEIPERLEGHGIPVDVVPAYRTERRTDVADQLHELLDHGEIDSVTLTSASAANALADALGTDGVAKLEGLTVASIGPMTTRGAESRGIAVSVQAASSTMDHLVNALIDLADRTHD